MPADAVRDTVMTRTISGTSDGYTLTATPGNNPVTITSAALLNGGLFADYYAGAQWTITNAGRILGPGVCVASAGTVTNSGSIEAQPGSAPGYGVNLRAGGSVTNAIGGVITGYAMGVLIYDASGTVVNYGSVAGGTFSAVELQSGGQVTNLAAGTITGYDFAFGVGIFDQPGTVDNFGFIAGSFMSAVNLDNGGQVTNESSGTIVGYSYIGVPANGVAIYNAPGTVTNFGVITSSLGTGIYVANEGQVTNERGAKVVGQYAGVMLGFAGGTLVNDGLIAGSGATYGGVTLKSGGRITNQSSGTISGYLGADGISVGVDLGTVTNAGVITSDTATAIELAAGGSVTNLTGGIIGGAVDGVDFGALASTLINAGEITAAVDAVKFSASFANRLVLDPGASFSGTVDGGNAIGAAGVSILELAAASQAGTLIRFGTQFENFGQVQVDAGADWNLGGGDSFAAGTTLADDGSLSLTGTSAVDAGSVTVNDASPAPALLTIGAGGTWTGTAALVVGAGGSGDLLVGSAASIAVASLDTGQTAGGSGAITVAGTQSGLGDTGAFVVGDSGVSSLAVEAGGTVAAGAGLTIANTASASGSSVDLSGAGSNLTVTGTLIVGDGGSGALSLSRGASVTAGALDVSATATGAGNVSLAGAGTTLGVTGALTLGAAAAGELFILAGAQMTIGGGVVGSSKTAPGNLDVEGGGSLLTINAGTLTVGADGPAELTLGIGAELNGEVANGPFGVVSEYGNVDPATDPNDGTQNVGFGNSLIYDYYIANSGTIKITSGTASFFSPLVTDETNAADGSTSGLWVIGAHDTLVMNTTSVDNTQTFDFTSPSAATLVIGQVPQANTTETDTFNGQTMPALTGGIAPGSPNVLPGWDAPIENFQSGDLIVLRGLTYGSATAFGDVVTVWSQPGGLGNALGSLTFLSKSGAASPTEAAAAAAEIDALACFAEGTRIATADGWVKVEALRVGDRVRVVSELSGPARMAVATGSCEPIVWLGSRTVDCARHPNPETVLPVRITAGAFGRNVPQSDLYLSPDHAVFVNGALVPVKLLVNGACIAYMKRSNITYYHVELPEHAVILAEGLPVESYLDTGDRANLAGAGTIRLFPDFAARLAPGAAMVWETRGAAPLVTVGARLAAVRRTVVDISPRRRFRSEGSAG